MVSSAPPPFSFAAALYPPDELPQIPPHPHPVQRAASTSRLSPASAASDSAPSYHSTHASVKADRPRLRRTTSNSPAVDNNVGLRFVTVTHPEDFAAPAVLQGVRKHVMNDWLEKNSKTSDSQTDPRQRTSSREVYPRKRLRSDDSTSSEKSVAEQEEAGELLSKGDALRIFRGGKKRKLSSPETSQTLDDGEVQETGTFQLSRPMFTMPDRNSGYRDFTIMQSPPMVSPMRTGRLPYDDFQVGPFRSIGRPVDPFRAMHQSRHDTIVSVEEMKFHCSQAFGTRAMGQYWIPSVVQSSHAFLSTLCIASTHLDAVNHKPGESIETIALRQEVMTRISEHLLNPASQVDDHNIIAVMHIAVGELIAGHETPLAYHEAGMEKMLAQRGGIEKLGVNGILAANLSWVFLQSAVLRESRARKTYIDYAANHPSLNYPNTSTIPESPLWCPRNDFETTKRSQRSVPKVESLLRDVRQMTRIFLGQEKQTSDQQTRNLYRRIMNLPSIMHSNTIHTPRDWTYEACRIAAAVQVTAMVRRIPLSEAFTQVAQTHAQKSSTATSRSQAFSNRADSPVLHFPSASDLEMSMPQPTPEEPQMPSYFSRPAAPSSNLFPSLSAQHVPTPPPAPSDPRAPLLAHLQKCLEASDLSDTWSDMAGVLYWITLIMCAACATPNASNSSSISDNSSTSTSNPSLSSSSSFHPNPPRSSNPLALSIQTSSSLSPSPSLPVGAPTPAFSPPLAQKDLPHIRATKKWLRALSIRCAIRLCFEHPEGVLKTVLAAYRVVERLGEIKEGSAAGSGIGMGVVGSASGIGGAVVREGREGIQGRKRGVDR